MTKLGAKHFGYGSLTQLRKQLEKQTDYNDTKFIYKLCTIFKSIILYRAHCWVRYRLYTFLNKHRYIDFSEKINNYNQITINFATDDDPGLRPKSLLNK